MKKRSIFCLFSAVVLGVLRVVTVRTSVFPDNGFYIDGTLLSKVFPVLYAAVIVLFAIISFTFKKKMFDEQLRGGIFGAAATAILAISFVWCGVTTLLSGSAAQGILALIGAAALIIAAPAHVMKGDSAILPLCLLIPCVWCSINLMLVFRSYSTIVTISDYLLDALSLTAMLLFLFYSAKAYVNNSGSAMLHFSGYFAFLGVFVTALPAAIAKFGSAEVFSIKFTPDLIVLAAMIIYIPMTVYTVEKNEIQHTSV